MRLTPLLVALAALGASTVWVVAAVRGPADAGDIRVGILHSDSGTMATGERAVADATLLAIEEVNQRGGVRGRKLVPVRAVSSRIPILIYTARELTERERSRLAEGVLGVVADWDG